MQNRKWLIVFAPGLLMFLGLVIAARQLKPSAPALPWDPAATFSIRGYDPASGDIGAAVQSRVFSVGKGVLWAEAGVGAVATQAIVDVSYGPQGLAPRRPGVEPPGDR